MVVTWRVAGIYKADAQKVAEEIGTEKITPEEVLEKARDKNTHITSLIFDISSIGFINKYNFYFTKNILT
jgi:uridylate kinase